MANYVEEVGQTWTEFLEDLDAGLYDEAADEDEVLEQTIRDYNDAVCEVGY
jgi:heme oxygenase